MVDERDWLRVGWVRNRRGSEGSTQFKGTERAFHEFGVKVFTTAVRYFY